MMTRASRKQAVAESRVCLHCARLAPGKLGGADCLHLAWLSGTAFAIRGTGRPSWFPRGACRYLVAYTRGQ